MSLHFRPSATDSVDLLRNAAVWADGQREDYWHPAPGKSVSFEDVIGVYLAVVRHLGTTIEDAIADDLPFAWRSYSAEDKAAINYVRSVFGLKVRR